MIFKLGNWTVRGIFVANDEFLIEKSFSQKLVLSFRLIDLRRIDSSFFRAEKYISDFAVPS